MGIIPRQSLTGKRYDAQTLVDGIFTKGAESPLAFKASVQPITGREMEQLPEGRRNNETYKLYTDFRLRTNKQGTTSTPADIVVWDGREFEVIEVQLWQNQIIPHYKVFISAIIAQDDN